MEYRDKYYEMKERYILLKNNLMSKINILPGGATSTSTYMFEGHRYTTYRTKDNKIFSFRIGRIEDYDIKKDTTTDTRKPNKDKILYINDRDTFDWFTLKYGLYGDDYLYIEWDRVAKDYGGFYLNRNNQELKKDRYAWSRKGSKGPFRVISWWSKEYESMPSGVWIF